MKARALDITFVGRFRDDFYYRLCSDIITVPPLRQRIRETGDVRKYHPMNAEALAEYETWLKEGGKA